MPNNRRQIVRHHFGLRLFSLVVPMLLFCAGSASAQDPCLSYDALVVGTGAVFPPIRIDSNVVMVYAQTWTSGDVLGLFYPYVRTWPRRNRVSLDANGVLGSANPNQTATAAWLIPLNTYGAGSYQAYSHHWATCGNGLVKEIGYQEGNQLAISRPTIAGNSGIWFLGTASVNDNCVPGSSPCYYNSTLLTLTSDPGDLGPTSSSPAVWSLSFPGSGTPFATYACQNNTCSQVVLRATSYPSVCSPIKVTASIGGFSSTSFNVIVDYAGKTILSPTQRPQDLGLPGPPPGYISRNTLRLTSNCGNTMFGMALHEEFPASPLACGGSVNWTAPVPRENWAGWITNSEGEFVDSVVDVCGDCTPPSNVPGPLQNPPTTLSTRANAFVSQFIYVGSRDTVNLKKYFAAAPNMQVVYTDHGRDEAGTWRCQ